MRVSASRVSTCSRAHGVMLGFVLCQQITPAAASATDDAADVDSSLPPWQRELQIKKKRRSMVTPVRRSLGESRPSAAVSVSHARPPQSR